jgi:hypothetical protein
MGGEICFLRKAGSVQALFSPRGLHNAKRAAEESLMGKPEQIPNKF